jgi:hypothetical protein
LGTEDEKEGSVRQSEEVEEAEEEEEVFKDDVEDSWNGGKGEEVWRGGVCTGEGVLKGVHNGEGVCKGGLAAERSAAELG